LQNNAPGLLQGQGLLSGPLWRGTDDQGTGAEISRRSPRSADPGSYSSQSLTPPPLGI